MRQTLQCVSDNAFLEIFLYHSLIKSVKYFSRLTMVKIVSFIVLLFYYKVFAAVRCAGHRITAEALDLTVPARKNTVPIAAIDICAA